MRVAAKAAADTPAEPSGPVTDYVVVWPAVSVHVAGQDEPLTVPQGATLPPEAAGQGPFLRGLGAVTAVTRV